MVRTIGRPFMSQTILLRVFKKMKRNPKKIYILRDFGMASSQRVYLNTLVKLELIEQCAVIYKTGTRYKSHIEIKGYRLR